MGGGGGGGGKEGTKTRSRKRKFLKHDLMMRVLFCFGKEAKLTMGRGLRAKCEWLLVHFLRYKLLLY